MILLYGILGACIAGIPLAAALIYQSAHNAGLKQQVSYYQTQEDQSLYLTVWALKEDIAAGEKLTKEKLEEKNVRVSKADNINSVTDVGQITGKNAKTALAKGTIAQADLFYEGEACTDDVRIREVSFVQLPVELKQNEYIDLRISYPDGEDYIVVKHKKVLGLLQEGEEAQTTGIRLELSEEEILRLSAARIDVNTYEDTALYAIQYREDFQAAAVHDYPVNSRVYSLLEWDPNVVNRMAFAGERKKRAVLERNLSQYESEGSVSRGTAKEDTAAEPSDMTGQEGTSELEIFE